MLRPTGTGLATAFFRFYLLETLGAGPARPAALLARIAAERLPFASGAYRRALQSLVAGGHLRPAPDGSVALAPLGAAERVAERERWRAMLPVALRLLGEVTPHPAPLVAAAAAAPASGARVAAAYGDRVLVAHVRALVAAAREGGRPFCMVLVGLAIEHPTEAGRRAMVHRAIRASLGGAATLFGGDVTAFRYGERGLALTAPCAGDPERGVRLAALARNRVDELVRTMSSSVRAFSGARWRIAAGGATWSAVHTTGALLRAAEDALDADVAARSAA